MELDEFQILQRKTCTRNHGITVSRTCVCARAAKVSTSITTGSQDGLVSPEAMEGTIFHVECDDTDTFAILHDQVESKVFDEEVGVMTERLAIQRVEQGVAGAVGGSCTAVCLTTFAIIQRLATKSTLINFSVFCSGERYTVMFKLSRSQSMSSS